MHKELAYTHTYEELVCINSIVYAIRLNHYTVRTTEKTMLIVE